METKLEEIIYPRKLKFFGVGAQILTVVFLFIFYTLYSYFQYKKTGSMMGWPISISILFVPIYEEFIFRGLVFCGLTKFYSQRNSIIIASLLFGIWHLKNIFFITTNDLIFQILYATIFFAPIATFATLKTKNIWIAVIFHYMNNILAPILNSLV